MNNTETDYMTLQKESSEAKLAFEKRISDLKAQCEDDHTVAEYRNEQKQTDARLQNQEDKTSTSMLHLKLQALEQELSMTKDAASEKEVKIIEL